MSLKKWFSEKWVDIGAKKKGGGYKPCGRKSASGSKRKYPKCVPAAKAARMTESQKRSAVARKRAAGNSGPKPTNVRTAFAGGIIPAPAMALSMAQQASPQDYVKYQTSGQPRQSYEAVKNIKQEEKPKQKSKGGSIFTNSKQLDYYRDLL